MIAARQGIVCAGLGLAALATAERADAFEFMHQCNGCSTNINEQAHVRRNTFSIPTGSTESNDLFTSVSEWNTQIMSRQPAIVLGTTSDTSSQIGDGQWEATLVTRASIGGALGKTTMLFGACLGFCVDINEADPKFANDLVFGNPDESAWDVAVGGTLAAREVMLHEWGHLIGLDHESGFNTMIAAGLKPRIGGTGSHSVPSGDDRKGAASLYGGPASFRNLGASATRFTGGAVTATTFAGTVFVTPGVTIVNMNFTLVNHGTGQLTFNWREHVNGCPDCTTGGTTWASWTGAVVNNRNQVFVPHSLPAPASLPCAFTFWTFHTVDTGGAHAESREFDNVTHHATTLRWQCF